MGAAAGFSKRCTEDGQRFSLIPSAENAAQMDDLRSFTRDLVTRLEADPCTRLDWSRSIPGTLATHMRTHSS